MGGKFIRPAYNVLSALFFFCFFFFKSVEKIVLFLGEP